MTDSLLIVLSLLFLGTYSNAQTYNSPESVVFDPVNNRYLISNAGNGTIIARSLSGTLTNFKTGLTAPKGMVVVGNIVYVTDVTSVKGYQLSNGNQVMNLSISGSLFLNDITSNGSTYLYVSDMNANRIFRIYISTQAYNVFALAGLNSPNGLYFDAPNNRIIVCSYISNSPIQAVNANTGTVSLITNTSYSNLDGITMDDSGQYYISSWGSNAIIRFNNTFTSSIVFSSGYNGPADIFYSTETKVLAIPNMNANTLLFKNLLNATFTYNGNPDICQGDSMVFTANTGSTLSYQWKCNGSLIGTNRVLLAKQAGQYHVVVSNHLGSATSGYVYLNVNALPSKPYVSVTGNTSFCLGDSTILSVPGGYSKYLWSNNINNRFSTAKLSGMYFCRVENSYGCKNYSDTIAIHVGPEDPYGGIINKAYIDVSGSKTFCDGDSAVLSGYNGLRNIWSNHDTNESITVKNSGKYSLIVIDSNNCSSQPSDTLNIVVYSNPAKPSISALAGFAFCSGDSIELFTSSGYFQYEWTNNKNTEKLIVKSGGKFNVRTIDSNGCISPWSDTVTVAEYNSPPKPVITHTGNLAFCFGDSVILIAPAGYKEYIWPNSNTAGNLTVKTSGKYFVMVVDSHNCHSPLSDTVTVTRYPEMAKVHLNYSGEKHICDGDSLEIIAPAGYSTYLWNTSEILSSIFTKSGGDYYVSVTDINGCTANSDTLSIIVDSLPSRPVISVVSGDTVFCEGDSVILSVPQYPAYLWSNNAATREIVVKTKGAFTIRVFNENGCKSPWSDTVSVRVKPKPQKPVITALGKDSLTCDVSGDFYQWFLNGNPIAGNTQIHYANVEGDYRVIVSLDGCTSDISEQFHFVPGSADDPFSFDFSVFPNPSKGIVALNIPVFHSPAKLQLYDFSGKLVYNIIIETNTALKLDLRQFPKGVYLLKITDEGRQGKKVLIIF